MVIHEKGDVSTTTTLQRSNNRINYNLSEYIRNDLVARSIVMLADGSESMQHRSSGAHTLSMESMDSILVHTTHSYRSHWSTAIH